MSDTPDTSAEARQKELDEYEARFGRYVQPHGPLNMVHFRVGVQGFAVFWEDDPEETAQVNEAQRHWFVRMFCCALHHLVEAESAPLAAENAALRAKLREAAFDYLALDRQAAEAVEPEQAALRDPEGTPTETAVLRREWADMRAENAALRAELASGSFYKESDIDAMQDEIAVLRARVEAAEGVCRMLAQSYDHERGVYVLGPLHKARDLAAWLTAPSRPDTPPPPADKPGEPR